MLIGKVNIYFVVWNLIIFNSMSTLAYLFLCFQEKVIVFSSLKAHL